MTPRSGRAAAAAQAAHTRRVAVLLAAPALLTIGLVAIVPMAATVWEALHLHDLRLPWLGRPFIGAENFAEALGDERFRMAALHTVTFAAVSVPLELAAGVVVALLMHEATRGRAAVRIIALLPWAIPTVVAALLWRFLFDAQAGPAAALLSAIGQGDPFVDPWLAWIPILLADAWKTTPFLAMLLLAGLQTIDASLYEAARVDGAGRWQQFRSITLPLLVPSLLVAATFRTLDALRIFDLPFVLTGGGPGTSTEPLSLYAFIALMQRLRFGYASALAVCVFLLTFGFALFCARALTRSMTRPA